MTDKKKPASKPGKVELIEQELKDEDLEVVKGAVRIKVDPVFGRSKKNP